MTNQIIISDISIHKDGQGRYSLNDLHTASGKEDKHQPAFFMRRHETIEMINEISNSAKSQSWKPTISKSGRYGGTYVCKELVYAYAMWISAAFALKVIRAYDALVSGNVEAKPKVRQCTATQLTPLRQTAERLITTGLGKIYPDIWKLVHQRFDVEHIHQLQPEQVGEAIEYLNVLEGEYLGRETLPATPSVHFTNEELCALCWVWNAAEYMREKLELAYPAMRTLKSEYA
ncbi:TPA: KilA-N domain-containing protein, partial [Salmonella enterica subsp. enterica serovar Senftenberg]|nr:KilA-N domain-containing protein [Salmonella enterica subsp. enterica serovar Senftenberg]